MAAPAPATSSTASTISRIFLLPDGESSNTSGPWRIQSGLPVGVSGGETEPPPRGLGASGGGWLPPPGGGGPPAGGGRPPPPPGPCPRPPPPRPGCGGA